MFKMLCYPPYLFTSTKHDLLSFYHVVSEAERSPVRFHLHKGRTLSLRK